MAGTMKLNRLRENWDSLAQSDPLWAIISWPEKKGRKWELDEFFETGRREVSAVMNYLASLRGNFPRRRALDFGCGVGRVTQHLADFFDVAYGVDIAPTMIYLARQYNRQGSKCVYYLNETDDLRAFDDNFFDFIYTNITLQHISPGHCRNYLREFVRTLAEDGALIFQLPDKPRLPMCVRQSLRTFVARSLRRPYMEMHGIRRNEAQELLRENGVEIIDITENGAAGLGWTSLRYCAMKRSSR
jgi:SAM-dependent methyltransferase